MLVDSKHKGIAIAALLIALLVSFAFGRFLGPEKVRVETKTVEAEKKTDIVKTDTDRHKETTITQTVSPDGTKQTVTRITEDTTKKTDSKDVTTDSKTSDTVKEVTRSASKVTLSALGGIYDLKTPVYGGSITKPMLGPIAVGVWGLSNFTVGVSIGLTF